MNPFEGPQTNKIETKDYKNFVSSFSREQILSENFNSLDTIRPTIVIPKQFFPATLSMVTDTSREVQGFFIVRKSPTNNNIRIVESMLTLGLGTEGDVAPEEDRLNAANKLLRESPEIRSIVFHTHPANLNSHYYENFSDLGENRGDAAALVKGLNRDPGYMHVLLTPTHLLTFGKEKPQIASVDSSDPDLSNERFTYWKNKFDGLIQ